MRQFKTVIDSMEYTVRQLKEKIEEEGESSASKIDHDKFLIGICPTVPEQDVPAVVAAALEIAWMEIVDVVSGKADAVREAKAKATSRDNFDYWWNRENYKRLVKPSILTGTTRVSQYLVAVQEVETGNIVGAIASVLTDPFRKAAEAKIIAQMIADRPESLQVDEFEKGVIDLRMAEKPAQGDFVTLGDNGDVEIGGAVYSIRFAKPPLRDANGETCAIQVNHEKKMLKLDERIKTSNSRATFRLGILTGLMILDELQQLATEPDGWWNADGRECTVESVILEDFDLPVQFLVVVRDRSCREVVGTIASIQLNLSRTKEESLTLAERIARNPSLLDRVKLLPGVFDMRSCWKHQDAEPVAAEQATNRVTEHLPT